MALLRTFSSLGCPGFTLEETFALAARHALAAVELRALGGTIDLPAYFAARYGTPAALAAQLRGAPIRIASLDTSLHLIAKDPGERERFLEFLPWAEALGVNRLRVFDGGKTADDAELARAAETVHWWQALRRERGWRADIMIETHDLLFTAEAIQRFLTVAPGTAILWDTHHTWKRGGEDPVKTWHAIKPHVVHLHVKDSVGRPSAKHPFTYVLPGEGEFPAAPLFAALKACDYAGPVSLEWELMWHPYLQPLDEALAAATTRRWW